MSALAEYFSAQQPAFSTEWFRFPDGRVTSYRFHRDTRAEKLAKVTDAGGVPVSDPFRKGAPLGGHRIKESA